MCESVYRWHHYIFLNLQAAPSRFRSDTWEIAQGKFKNQYGKVFVCENRSNCVRAYSKFSRNQTQSLKNKNYTTVTSPKRCHWGQRVLMSNKLL